jgi:hypothetical protein
LIATYTGTLSGAFLTPGNLPAGYEVNYSIPNEIIIQVPEPGAWILMMGGLGALGLFHRRLGRRRNQDL